MRFRLNTDSFSRRNRIPAITGIVQARRNGALEKQAAGHIPPQVRTDGLCGNLRLPGNGRIWYDLSTATGMLIRKKSRFHLQALHRVPAGEAGRRGQAEPDGSGQRVSSGHAGAEEIGFSILRGIS